MGEQAEGTSGARETMGPRANNLGSGLQGSRKASCSPRHKDTVLSQARQVHGINKADTLSRGLLCAGRTE